MIEYLQAAFRKAELKHSHAKKRRIWNEVTYWQGAKDTLLICIQEAEAMQDRAKAEAERIGELWEA